ncbi:hypothetical protein [Pelagicoccus mobilis]|uniref:Uncharacterized protein n=1 Tax=Pelagicoccus mobilis TaxID=415221 RepID=A0A934RZP6_9BACT|nr:hypothetical protein [Pelagicoccus mobilis]MBK1877257.1 hypothetical protein [Pelagicoccus mobilis]
MENHPISLPETGLFSRSTVRIDRIQTKYQIPAEGGRGGLVETGRPLFSGYLKASSSFTNQEFDGPAALRPDSSRTFNLYLNLNPTRFLAHQQYHAEAIDTPSADLGPVNLSSRETTQSTGYEVLLGPNDNALVSFRLAHYGNANLWWRHLERYWSATVAGFSQRFIESNELAQSTLSHSEYLTIQSIEVYWEFTSEDAIGLVHNLAPIIRGLGNWALSQEFHNPLCSELNNSNCLSVRVKTRRGTYLKVYAKTTKRIRFEVEFRVRDLGDRAPETENRRNYSAFIDILRDYNEMAAQEVNTALEQIELANSNEYDCEQVSPYVLMHRVVQVLDNPVSAEAILALLINSGGYIQTTRGDSLSDEISAIRRAGIIETITPRLRNYRIAPIYRRAITELSGQNT